MEQSDSPTPSEPKAESFPEVLNIKQAALYLRIGVGMMHEFVAADTIPHFWRESRVFFRKAELDRWVAEAERLHMRSQTITLEQAAEHLEIDPQALFQLAEQGKISAVRDGDHWRFTVASLDAWFERRVKREIAKRAEQSETANPQTIESSPRTRTASAPAAAMNVYGPMTALEKKQAAMRNRQLAARETAHPGPMAETRAASSTWEAASSAVRLAIKVKVVQCKCPICGNKHESSGRVPRHRLAQPSLDYSLRL